MLAPSMWRLPTRTLCAPASRRRWRPTSSRAHASRETAPRRRRPHSPQHERTRPRRLRFSIGQLTPVSGSLANQGPDVPIPAAIQQPGSRKLNEFVAGRDVFFESGCGGCHRLAGEGNSGPGPDLDDIGSLLSERQLVRSLTDPTAPMPSFKNLPPDKFKALVIFLSLLRRH